MSDEWSSTHDEIVKLLHRLYGLGSFDRIIDRTHLDSGLIARTGTPYDQWHALVKGANSAGQILHLLSVVKDEFPNLELNHLAGRLVPDKPVEAPKSFKWLGSKVDIQALEKLTGSQSTFLPVSFLEIGLERSKSVCRIEKFGMPIGTGFLTNKNVLITNHHVIPDRNTAALMKVRFNYQQDANGQDASSVVYALAPDSLFEFSPSEGGDDWTAVRVAENPNSRWGALYLEEIGISENDFVNVIQHPEGMHKQIAIYHNVVKYAGAERVQYLTDTSHGSSGSPVFDSQWRIVALHHAGGLLPEPGSNERFYRNEGISISALVRGLRTKGILPDCLEPIVASEPHAECAVEIGQLQNPGQQRSATTDSKPTVSTPWAKSRTPIAKALIVALLAAMAYTIYEVSVPHVRSSNLRENVVGLHSANILSLQTDSALDAEADIHGTSRNLGSTETLWVVVKAAGENKYYTLKSPARAPAPGEWEWHGCIGPAGEFGKNFDIIAVVANKSAEQILREDGDDDCKRPFYKLPDGAGELSSVRVSRNPLWSRELQ